MKIMAKSKNNKSFEESIARLEEISEALESGELPLEDAIKLYEEGIDLSKACYKKLEEAELKITQLRKDLQTGESQEFDFEN
jgi:exodeoxyribonuclease VII small subunit